MHQQSFLEAPQLLVIPPGGHAEIVCGTMSAQINNADKEAADMTRDTNALESLMIRPEALQFYRELSTEERKKLDGLEGYALAGAIEDMMMKGKLDALFDTLPAAEQRKLLKLPDNQRYEYLLEKNNKAGREAYESERKRAKATVDYIKKNLAPQQLSLLAPYPHDLARRSVFFIEDPENKSRELLSDFVIGAGSWGLTTYTGKKLFTADEKAWVVLLALAAELKKRGNVDWHIVKGSIRSFLRDAGLDESGHYTKRFLESIQAMHGGVFKFEGKPVVKADGKPKKRPLKERIEGWHLISSYTVDNSTDEFIVVLDRGFIETFITEFHMYARLDIRRFCRQSPSSAALHRFFAGHTPGPDGCLRMNLFLVAKATNMLTDYPQDLDEWPDADVKYSKKRLISRALARLVQDGTFGPRTCVKSRGRGEDDLVIIDFEIQGRITAKPKKAIPRAKQS